MDYLVKAKDVIRKQWFVNHVIKSIKGEEGFQEIIFGQQDTSMYQVKYVLAGNMVYISGDLGVAAFELTGPATIKELSRYDLSYFTGKLVASQRKKFEFCERKAKKEIQEYVFDWSYVDEVSQLDEESRSVYYELLSGTQEYGTSEMFNAIVYNIWQNSPDIRWFDSEGATLIAGVGQQLSYSIISYWVGLQMIAEIYEKESIVVS